MPNKSKGGLTASSAETVGAKVTRHAVALEIVTDRNLAHLAAFFAKAQGPLFAEVAEITISAADLREGNPARTWPEDPAA